MWLSLRRKYSYPLEMLHLLHSVTEFVLHYVVLLSIYIPSRDMDWLYCS